MSDVSTERLREILAGCDGVTPGPWYTSGLPWFQTGSGVMAGSPDPHVGFIIADTEPFEGERAEYLENSPAVPDLADADMDAAYLARLDPQTVASIISELIRRREAGARELLDLGKKQ